MLPSLNARKWDVLIIGSGVGGLMTGALLAKYFQKKVLVLERHTKIGGCTHCFDRRKDYHYDVGVHYISGMNEDNPIRKALSKLTNNRLQWKQLSSENKIFFNDQKYTLPASWEDVIDYLSPLFPHEKKALRKFVAAVRKASTSFTLWNMAEAYPFAARIVIRLYLQLFCRTLFQSVDQVMGKIFKDRRLIEILTYITETTGLPSSVGSFGIYASAADNSSNGCWYPVGGGDRIAIEMAKTIEDHGGEIITSCEVDKILVKDGTAFGVQASLNRDRTTGDIAFYSDLVISNAGAHTTYSRFLRDEPKIEYDTPKGQPKDYYSYVMVSIGLSVSAQTFGIDGANHWIYPDYKTGDPNLDALKILYVCSPSVRRGLQSHTLEIISIVPTEFYKKWDETSWRKRSQEYKDFKKKLADLVLETVDSHFMGVKDAVLFAETSTPLTVEHFITGKNGALWIPATPARLHSRWNNVRTPIRNLYLTGGDVFASGVVGALLGGIKAFHLITKDAVTRKGAKLREPLPLKEDENAATQAQSLRPDPPL